MYQSWSVVAFEQPTAAKWNILGTNDDFFNTSIVALQAAGSNGWIASGETWTYASADAPTFTFTISGDKTTKYSVGMRIKVTQSTGGTKYFIITAVSYSAPNTTVTIYGGTDYTLNNQAISSPYYSREKAPLGFPLNPDKWSVEFKDTVTRNQASPSINTWYNIGTSLIAVPIGSWVVSFQVGCYAARAAAVSISMQVALSTANNTANDLDFAVTWYVGSVQDLLSTVFRQKTLNLAAKANYYLNANILGTSSITSLQYLGAQSTTIIRATCAYL